LHRFDACRFLELAVIGGLFERKVLKAAQVSLMFFPNPLVDSFDLLKVLRPFAKKKSLPSLFKDAIKRLGKDKRA